MIKNAMLAVVAAGGLAVMAGESHAVTYDYTGGATNPGGPALSCDVGGILNTGCAVTYNTAGLGVNGFPDFEPGQIDGSPIGSSESLTFDFGFDMVWNSLKFGRWDSVDDATLTWAGGSTTWGPNAGSVVDLGGVVSSFLTVTASGVFWKDGLVFGNDKFTVKKIDVSPVPLPAAGWMLLAGLGGIAAIKRRRKAA